MEKKQSNTTPDEAEGVLNAYARRTTWHGLHYVFTSDYWTVRRIIWGILTILHILYFLFWTYEIMVLYLSFPVRTNTAVHHTSSVNFPVVTICPQNPLKLTSLSDAGTYASIKSAYQTALSWDDAVAKAGQNVTAVATTAGPVLTDLVLSCKFAGLDCINGTASTTMWSSVLTAAGQCYSFTAQSGQTAPGALGGLRLTLNSEAYETTYDIGGVPGVKVIVHSSGDRPLLAEGGVDVSPGFKVMTQVSQTKNLRLAPPYSDCDSRVALTQRTCRLECLALETTAACQCKPFYNAVSGDTVCSNTTQMACAQDVANKFLTTGKTEGNCNCPAACSEQDFSIKTTFSQLMETAISRQLSADAKVAMSNAFTKAQIASTNTGSPGLPASLAYSDNVVSLEVFYNTLQYTQTVQEAAYSFFEHAKDHMISVLVLFGASLMSFWELVDLICVAIARCCKRNNKGMHV